MTAVPVSDAAPRAAGDAVRDVLQQAAQRLAGAGVPDPQVDAELLLAHLRGQSRGEVQAAVVRGDDLTRAEADAYETLVARRAAREPLQHITGVAYFRHLELAVGPGVFVPRPETETVAQIAIDALRAAPGPWPEGEGPVGVDLGAGSGAIALSLATEVPHARIHAAENSPYAFVWTKENVRRVGAENLRLVFADLAVAFADLDGTVDVVVSNPPYVPDDAIPRDPEVRLHDPEAALYGGPDGLDVVRQLSHVGRRLLRAGGTLVIEHGELQGTQIRELLTADGWRAAATHPDLTLRDRTTTAIRP
ncbi:peptide chain release factor N(5)-glutamine methyltransferase [Microbacterium marinilacus]|uniref:Release factor glutamine methyltransferase n=1 Tax=Microbacterium marinilacus TaxID=415209 RepID=A0ABP7BM01_9MICO|nr:peptide chain release factor N(5)-glutamine methyltransferase [Microbacterium marinilacus]MBY0690071.1 peptide chain release factor N(5)-glutamine methyltransferase [Microbacterium marinilacus]